MADDKPSGFLEYSIKEGMPGSDGTSVHIEGIHTNSRYRRNGIASALVDILAEIAVTKGIKRVTSDIEPWNEESLAFHYAVAFKKTASDDESVFVEKIID